MKDTMHSGGTVIEPRRDNARGLRPRKIARCSICTRRTWFNGIPLREPQGVPEPRNAWVLCHRCHQALLIEMQRSPVQTPLRLRIAIGLVAAERSPHAYGKTSAGAMSDKAWILFIAWGFAIAMVFHLILIVMLAFVK